MSDSRKLQSYIDLYRLVGLRSSCQSFNLTLSRCKFYMKSLLSDQELAMADNICSLLSQFIGLLDVNIDAQHFVDVFLSDILHDSEDGQ